MVLAAGVGSRLDPLTANLPKPLVPVVNKPVMEHILRLLKRHGLTEICANLHYLPEKIREYFGDGSQFGVKLHFEFEAKLSGDAGGVRACRKFLEKETFIVIMGDLITDADLSALIKKHRDKKALASIAVKKMADVSRFGVVVRNDEGFITGFQEKPKPEEALSDLISTGIYILEPEVFEFIPPEGDYGFGRQLFPKLVESGQKVLAIEIESYWSDVGTIDQYRESNLHALAGLVDLQIPGSQSLTNAHVRLDENALLDPTVSIAGNVLVGKNARVGAGSKISGNVVIGDNCLIDNNCSLTDSVLWSGTHIESGSSITRSVVGFDCKLQSKSNLNDEAIVAPLKRDLTGAGLSN
jgi:NDP-sugar pyrophosphorylase family protein